MVSKPESVLRGVERRAAWARCHLYLKYGGGLWCLWGGMRLLALYFIL